MNANPLPPGTVQVNPGPRDEPTLSRDHRPSMGVFADCANPSPLGQAHGAGWMQDSAIPG